MKEYIKELNLKATKFFDVKGGDEGLNLEGRRVKLNKSPEIHLNALGLAKH